MHRTQSAFPSGNSGTVEGCVGGGRKLRRLTWEERWYCQLRYQEKSKWFKNRGKLAFTSSHDMVTSPGFAFQTHAENLMKYTKQPSSNIRQKCRTEVQFLKEGNQRGEPHCHWSPCQIKQNTWWAELWRKSENSQMPCSSCFKWKLLWAVALN